MLRLRLNKPKLFCVIATSSLILSCQITFIILKGLDISDLKDQIENWKLQNVDQLNCSEFCQDFPFTFNGQCCDSSELNCQIKINCLYSLITNLQNSIDWNKNFMIWLGVSFIIFLVVIISLSLHWFRRWRNFQRQQRQRMQSALIQPPPEIQYGFDDDSFQNYEDFIQYLIDGGYIIPGPIKKRGDDRITSSFATTDDENCSICISAFSQEKVLKLPCNHKFHSQCIRDWNQTNSSCPICRADIYPQVPIQEIQEEEEIEYRQTF